MFEVLSRQAAGNGRVGARGLVFANELGGNWTPDGISTL
jgi:hypothetical protein